MGFIPANRTVALRSFSEDEETDAHGNPVTGWSDPVDHPVCWWATPTARGDTGEPKMAGHDRVVVDLELCAPSEFPAGPHDKIVVPGKGEFEVQGYDEDFDNGPFSFVPGVVIWNLKRVEG